jgi:hypothetical protein
MITNTLSRNNEYVGRCPTLLQSGLQPDLRSNILCTECLENKVLPEKKPYFLREPTAKNENNSQRRPNIRLLNSYEVLFVIVVALPPNCTSFVRGYQNSTPSELPDSEGIKTSFLPNFSIQNYLSSNQIPHHLPNLITSFIRIFLMK